MARSDGPEPRAASATRLLKAHALFFEIARAESEHIARAWMIGSNPLLDSDTPITAIREDRLKEVTAAANAFLADSSA